MFLPYQSSGHLPRKATFGARGGLITKGTSFKQTGNGGVYTMQIFQMAIGLISDIKPGAYIRGGTVIVFFAFYSKSNISRPTLLRVLIL